MVSRHRPPCERNVLSVRLRGRNRALHRGWLPGQLEGPIHCQPRWDGSTAMLRDSRGVVITRRGHSTAMPNSSMTSGVAWKEPIASRSDGLLDLGTVDWLGQEAPAVAVLPTTGGSKRKPPKGKAGAARSRFAVSCCSDFVVQSASRFSSARRAATAASWASATGPTMTAAARANCSRSSSR